MKVINDATRYAEAKKKGSKISRHRVQLRLPYAGAIEMVLPVSVSSGLRSTAAMLVFSTATVTHYFLERRALSQ